MASLAEVNETLENQSSDLSTIRDRITELVELSKPDGDDLEAKFEAGRLKRKAGGSTKITNNTSESGFRGLPFAIPLAGLAGIVASTLSAIAAEFLDLDAVVKALNFPQIIQNFKAFGEKIKALPGVISQFVDDIINKLPKIRIPELPELKLPKLPKIDLIIPENWGVIRLPKLPVPKLVTDAGEAIVDASKFAIKLPVLAIESLRDALNTSGLSKFFSTITDVIGTGTGIVADLASAGGRGILGFLSIVGSGFEAIKKIPLFGTAVSVLVRPFTQFLISAFDFVQGFIEGFRSVPGIVAEDGTITYNIKAKILAGLDAGFENVINGILEGLDLIFVTVPRWILDKMGVSPENNPLRDIDLTTFTEPIWNTIKSTFKFIFDPEYAAAQIQKFKDKYNIKDMIENFFKGIKESVKDFFGMGEDAEKRLELQNELKGLNYNPNRNEDQEARYQELMKMMNAGEIPQFSQGTKGFQNFGTGTPAILHGSEAVVSESSPAGNILKSANTTRVAEALSSMAMGGGGAQVVYVDNSDNSSSVVSKGGDTPISLPGSESAVDVGFQRKFSSLMGHGHSVGNVY